MPYTTNMRPMKEDWILKIDTIYINMDFSTY